MPLSRAKIRERYGHLLRPGEVVDAHWLLPDHIFLMHNHCEERPCDNCGHCGYRKRYLLVYGIPRSRGLYVCSDYRGCKRRVAQ